MLKKDLHKTWLEENTPNSVVSSEKAWRGEGHRKGISTRLIFYIKWREKVRAIIESWCCLLVLPSGYFGVCCKGPDVFPISKIFHN